ncbi:mediator of RNA polymerase II transcription subunit 11-like [Saccostrea cucullata]|uniref:mediator of RNA polymerase II transcription subunit 11-like n=1 Tax=Saccostrea echinata TaxID=191078 RepID=UPI002A83E163|nr:mediator of RNA polymerase II transcription subunit 11-like [Saccostrea echinata]
MAGSSSAPSSTVERLKQLEAVEGDIVNAIQSAGSALQELSKDKPVMKNVESHTTTFIKTLVDVEKKLTGHINYLTQVSTGQPHEGSSYAPQKDLLLAYHRIDHIRSRLNDLERVTAEPVVHRQQLTQSDLLQMSEQH